MRTKPDNRRINKVWIALNPLGETYVFGKVGTGKNSYIKTIGTGHAVGEWGWLPKDTFEARKNQNNKTAQELYLGKIADRIKMIGDHVYYLCDRGCKNLLI